MTILKDGIILVSDSGNKKITALKEEIIEIEGLSWDEKYAEFSQSVDDWWNETWKQIITYEI